MSNWIDQTFSKIETLLIQLNQKGHVTFYHRMYNTIYFEYKVDNICNGVITCSTPVSKVDKLIIKLENLNNEVN